LGFDPFTTNLLTIPSVCWKAHLRAKCNSRTNLFSFQTVFHIINLLLITHLSERLNQRALVAVWQNLWTLPCIIALRFWPGVVDDAWGTYILITVLLSYPYCREFHSSSFYSPANSHQSANNSPSSPLFSTTTDAINVAWVSRNANNVATRTIASALYNVRLSPHAFPFLHEALSHLYPLATIPSPSMHAIPSNPP
jgi:hypothetical protein